MRNLKATVIGSGIAGLAAAIRMACDGFTVDVFEKNASPGGKLSLLKQNGFVFDTGPSLFTQPENIEELFTLAGENTGDSFRYRKLNIACRYFFENGKIVNGYTDKAKFAAELNAVAGEPEVNINQYLHNSEQRYNSLGNIFLNKTLHHSSTWLNRKTAGVLKDASPALLIQSLDNYNKRHLKSSEARQIFNRFATYNGSNPFSAPAMLSIIPHLEHNEGIFYPEGGMISIVNALFDLAKKLNVRFHFNSTVEKIVSYEGNITGIICNGEPHSADIVLSNADIYFTFKNLLGDSVYAEKIASQERSSSALVFYWGICNIFPGLELHNIFFSKNQKEEFRNLFELKRIFHDPTIYINLTSKMEAQMAPAGKQNWFVMINAPSGSDTMDQEWVSEIRKSILWKLNRMLQTRLEDLIETESIMTPADIEQNTDAWQGALYGASSNSIFSAFKRHPNFSKKYRGLYFAGGTVHPGGGIPLCFRSASIACDLIRKTFNV